MNIQRNNWLISRRHALRGLGATLALPLLDCMKPARAAAASAACRPIDDKRGTKEFRIKVAGVLARRAADADVDRPRHVADRLHHGQPLEERLQCMVDGRVVDVGWVRQTGVVGGDELAVALNRAVDGGPFLVTGVEAVGPAEHRCAFRVKHSGLTIGYRNIIDLQHRLAQQFDIVRVERTAGIAG